MRLDRSWLRRLRNSYGRARRVPVCLGAESCRGMCRCDFGSLHFAVEKGGRLSTRPNPYQACAVNRKKKIRSRKFLVSLHLMAAQLRLWAIRESRRGRHRRADRQATKFICVHSPLFACAMLKRAVAGINVSLAVRVRMAALSMSGSFRTAG